MRHVAIVVFPFLTLSALLPAPRQGSFLQEVKNLQEKLSRCEGEVRFWRVVSEQYTQCGETVVQEIKQLRESLDIQKYKLKLLNDELREARRNNGRQLSLLKRRLLEDSQKLQEAEESITQLQKRLKEIASRIDVYYSWVSYVFPGYQDNPSLQYATFALWGVNIAAYQSLQDQRYLYRKASGRNRSEAEHYQTQYQRSVDLYWVSLATIGALYLYNFTTLTWQEKPGISLHLQPGDKPQLILQYSYIF